MIEIAPLNEIAPFHGSYLLIWKGPIHFERAVGGTSLFSFLVSHIFIPLMPDGNKKVTHPT